MNYYSRHRQNAREGGAHEAGHSIAVLALGGSVNEATIKPHQGSGLTRYNLVNDDEAAIVSAAGPMGEFFYHQLAGDRPILGEFQSPNFFNAQSDTKSFQALKTRYTWTRSCELALSLLQANRRAFLIAADVLTKTYRLDAADLRQLGYIVRPFDLPEPAKSPARTAGVIRQPIVVKVFPILGDAEPYFTKY